MRCTYVWVWLGAMFAACASGASHSEGVLHEAAENASPSLRGGSSSPDEPRAASRDSAWDTLAWPDRIGIERAMAESDPRHAPTIDDGRPHLVSRGATAAFGEAAELHVGEHAATLRAVSLGRGETRTELAAVTPTIEGVEVRAQRAAGIVEWWRSLASGLEHGVTIAERPEGDAALTLALVVTGLGTRSVDEDSIALTDDSGEAVATYAHLVVTDAHGLRVPAAMRATSGGIEIAVQDSGAAYPLVVDPILIALEAVLAAPTESAAQFGHSVAVSADGTRVLVGSPGASVPSPFGPISTGVARVFVRSGTTWSEEARLVASAADSGDRFGESVALSADGTRALVGAPRDGIAGLTNVGSAWVFVRTGTTWTEEATLLATEGADQGAGFGVAVALTADGTRGLVGTYSGILGRGPFGGRVYLRSGSSWTHEASLTMPDIVPTDFFGQSVALSADGTRALVGAPEDDTMAAADVGSVRTFVRAGTTWMAEATLLASDGASGDRFGASVALSSDGSWALVGAPRDDTGAGTDAGSARVFTRPGSSWVSDATLVASDGEAGDRFGTSVGVSADASRAIIGVPQDNDGIYDAGSARLFVRNGVSWSSLSTLLAPTVPGPRNDWLGFATAMAADGSRAVAGAPQFAGAGFNYGNARVFSLLATPGTACTALTAGGCASGFCVDGVCCDTACGGGADDCQACGTTAGGMVDGVCGPLRSMTMMPTCRPAVDLCDQPEVCSPTSTACPADALRPSTHECRPTMGRLCDVAETCTGSSAACPADARAAAGVVCRIVAGVCDRAEVCDGGNADCPSDLRALADTECRPSLGACDPAEACDGTSVACPANSLLPMGTVCGVGMGDCATPGVCTGTDVLCPSTGFRPSGTFCRAAMTSCDVDDFCDGMSQVCADRFAPATQPCGGPPSGACDEQDHCTGTSGDCMATFRAGVECRASTGGCDAAELCTGGEANCPSDQFSPVGTVCRASTESCDPAESCDGSTASCPADVTTCGMSDGGVSDGGGIDGGSTDGGGRADTSGTDAGPPPVPAEGCACHVAPRSPLPLLGTLVSLAWVLATRRRMAGRRSQRSTH